MGLDQLSKQITVDAKKESNSIIKRAQKEKEAIIKDAVKKRQQIITSAKKEVKEIISVEKNERISAARLKAKKIESEAKNALVEEVMKEVWKEFSKQAKQKGYHATLKELIKQGEKGIGEGSIVFVNKTDQKVAKKIAKNLSKQPANIVGGAIIYTKDKKISIDNSLESLFEQNKENIRKQIFNNLFGSKSGGKK